MNDNILQFVIKAKDEASSVLKSVAQGAENMQPTFQKMAAVGTVAFGAISAAVLKTTADYADAEASALQLRHAVIDVSHATEEQLKATSDLADALERKGVLDGDNIKIGLAQLSTFGLSNDAVQKLGGSLSDLAVNQFGVKASGDQLSQSANMIAKALNGQFGVLEKSGIRFSDAQQNMIKFGSEMDKVKAINEGFAQNLKYTNEVALQGLEGQTAKTQVQLGNLSEAIGGALAPAMQSLLSFVRPMVESFVAWATEHPKLITGILGVSAGIAGLIAGIGVIGLVVPSIIAGIGVLTTVLGSLGAVFGIVSTAVGFLNTAFWFLAANPIVLIIGGIILALIALGFAIYEVWKHWDEILLKTKVVWEEIKTFLFDAFNSMVAWSKEKLAVVQQVFTDAFTSVKNTIFSIWDSIQAKIQAVIDWISQKVSQAMSMVSQVSSAISSPIASAYNSASSAVSSLFGGKKADGGPVRSDRGYLVGERGPEMFYPNATGRVQSANSGGLTVVITGNTFMGNEDMAVAIGDMIMNRLSLVQKI